MLRRSGSEGLPTEGKEMTITGSKYAGYQDAALIAKQVRADIKQAQKTGLIPTDLKVSVRCDKYSMGQSVNVSLTGWSNERVWNIDTEGFRAMTPEAKAVTTQIDQIRNAYNRDNSDPMTDYYEVVYYGVTQWGAL